MNVDFIVPYYILEELIEYKSNLTTLENLKCLLNLAVFNNRITKEQAEQLIKKYIKAI